MALRLCVAVWVVSSWVVGCAETSTGSSHVRAGDLYAPGQDRYDDYFAAVHSQQATSAQWAADRKTSHQAIIDALKLDEGASNETIEHAAQSKHSAHAVAQAVEKTVHADTERAKDLDGMASKIDELLKTGHELEGHVSEDFGKPGSGQSAPSPANVKMELRASYEVLSKIRDRAKEEAKSAEDFVAALQQKGGHEAHAAHHATSTKPAQASSAPPPGSNTSQPAAAAPQPKPPPAPAGEVFQP